MPSPPTTNDEEQRSNVDLASNIPQFNQGAFVYSKINPNSWDKYFPYQLLILEVDDKGKYSQTPWRYTLPIPPQSLRVSMPTAETIQRTLTGYNEVHGGAPFRHISFNATTGIWPGRQTVASSTPTSPAESIFGAGGALQAISAGAVQLATGSPPRVANALTTSQFETQDLAKETGYYRFHQLREFIEGYIALKNLPGQLSLGDKDAGKNQILKTFDPKKLRLGFCIWKDESVYLCTIKDFTYDRSTSNPLEYTYSMQLTASARVRPSFRGQSLGGETYSVSGPTSITKFLNRVAAVGKIVRNSQRLIALGLQGPLQTFTELARQTQAFIKDVGGIARTITDMPASFIRDVVGEMVAVAQAGLSTGANFTAANAARLAQVYKNLPIDIQAQFGQVRTDYLTAAGGNNPQISPSGAAAYSNFNDPEFSAIRSQYPGAGQIQSPYDTGDSPTFIDPTRDGRPVTNNQGINVDDLLVDSPEFGDTDLSQLPLSDVLQARLDEEITQSLNTTATDFRASVIQLQNASDLFVSEIGSWNAVYNETYGLPTPTSELKDPTPEELDVIFAVNELQIIMGSLIASLDSNDGKVETAPGSMEYVAGLAERSGIAFRIPTSKMAIPFPAGATLERIAAQYLNDANRWHEIATLNGLRSPYIDEVGFQRQLPVNGDGSTVHLDDASNVGISQMVWLSSDTIKKEGRRVINIQQLAPTDWLITVDGAADLDRFTTADNARLNAFLPGTTNSNQSIFIPSEQPPNPFDEDLLAIPGIDIFDPLLRAAGVDFKVDDNFGLIISDECDFALAYGLQGIVQRVRVILSTPQYALLQHPLFGFNASVGTNLTEMNLASLNADLDDLLVGESGIVSLRGVQAELRAPKLALTMQLGIVGLNTPVNIRVPISSN